MTACSVAESRSDPCLAVEKRGVAQNFLTVARPAFSSRQIYIQPMSNSYHLEDSLADVACEWWLLCSSSPPIRMPHGTMFVLASSASKLRYPNQWPTPLMTPAAQNGIQTI